jgi:hypothetical protein
VHDTEQLGHANVIELPIWTATSRFLASRAKKSLRNKMNLLDNSTSHGFGEQD